MKTLKELNEALDANIPRSAVKQREGANKKKFSYLSADYVIGRMNSVAGNLNWSSRTRENKPVYEGVIRDSYGKEKFTCHYIAIVDIEIQHIDEQGRVIRTSHSGTGYGDGSDASNPGKAHELAAKEAESDALKRGCKNLGQSMGLALYDKDQTNVEDDSAGKPAQVAASTPSAATSSPKSVQAPVTPNVVSDPGARPPAGTGDVGRRTDPAPTRPAFDRSLINRDITATSKVVIAMQKSTKDS